MPHRDFSTPPTDEQQPSDDPITFGLAGQTFQCIDPPLPYGYLLDIMGLADLIDLVDLDPNDPANFARLGEAAKMASTLEEWIVGVLVDEDQARFRKLRYDRKNRVGFESLRDVMLYLVTEYSNRPTEPSASSSPGPSPTATTSTGGSPSSPAST